MDVNRWPRLLFISLVSFNCDYGDLSYKFLSCAENIFKKCNANDVFAYYS